LAAPHARRRDLPAARRAARARGARGDRAGGVPRCVGAVPERRQRRARAAPPAHAPRGAVAARACGRRDGSEPTTRL
ncbi:MAG: hypothetical protein AVDCRST_MAG11-4111, partial [uncultured Gemmatimonadaceae bacterium]